MTLTAKVFAGIDATITETRDNGDRSASIDSGAKSTAVANGTSAGQCDLVFSDERTLAASASEDLDLAGVLTDEFGAAITFAKIRGIYIEADAGNTNNVVIGGAASAQFQGPFGAVTETLALKPGDAIMLRSLTAGWPVTATTADLLKIANSGAGTSVTYKIILLGTSA